MAAKNLTKADARRALVRYQLRTGSLPEVFQRLRCVQFDPLNPAGCNHDLVLQARVEGYRVGDWQRAAYPAEGERTVYDGWDKQACLIPFSGWPLRRIYHRWHEGFLERVSAEAPDAVETVLAELAERGPMTPRQFDFQDVRPEWRGSWYGPSLTKRVLRALWHTGRVLTHSRKGPQHVYDLAERVVPARYLEAAPLAEADAVRELVLERHRSMGLVRPGAQSEVWSMRITGPERRAVVKDLVARGDLVELEVDGVKAHACPEFLGQLDDGASEPRAVVLAPLDQLLWDRKMVAHLFGFDYVWEVYKPAAQRKWGYYVLPVLCGDRFVARFDPWCRNGALELRSWHWEPGEPSSPQVREAVCRALARFKSYLGAAGLDEREDAEKLSMALGG
jgi:uncharacterized protein